MVENEFGRVKIGRSIEPDKRIRAISTGAGVRINKTYISDDIENFGKIESESLRYFRNDNSIGEWVDGEFDNVVSFVSGLVRTKGIANDHKKENTINIDDDPFLNSVRESNNNLVSEIKDMGLYSKARMLLSANDVLADFCTNSCTSKEAISGLYKIINEFAYSDGEQKLQEKINELKTLSLSAKEKSKIKWKIS